MHYRRGRQSTGAPLLLSTHLPGPPRESRRAPATHRRIPERPRNGPFGRPSKLHDRGGHTRWAVALSTREERSAARRFRLRAYFAHRQSPASVLQYLREEARAVPALPPPARTRE